MQLKTSSIFATGIFSLLFFSGCTTAIREIITCTGSGIAAGGPCIGNSDSCACKSAGILTTGNCDTQGNCVTVVAR
ncbi:hypothetical protein ACJQWK_01794 [Exserohilum turcicum]